MFVHFCEKSEFGLATDANMIDWMCSIFCKFSWYEYEWERLFHIFGNVSPYMDDILDPNR